jgi:hypothetical protein
MSLGGNLNTNKGGVRVMYWQCLRNTPVSGVVVVDTLPKQAACLKQNLSVSIVGTARMPTSMQLAIF